jgi:hypothetical protein
MPRAAPLALRRFTGRRIAFCGRATRLDFRQPHLVTTQINDFSRDALSMA